MVTGQPYLFLGSQRTLYFGPLAPKLSLSLAASRLLVSLDAPFLVRQGHQRQGTRCLSALLPVGGRFVVESSGQPVADVHLDVSGSDFAGLRQRCGLIHRGDWFSALADESTLQQNFSELFRAPPGAEHMAGQLDAVLFPAGTGPKPDHSLDRRIRQVLDLIRDHPEDNLPLSSLASQVGLSNSRLVNLFKSQVGVPIRRYRLWHRLFIACTWLSQGLTVTEAAHQSGFSDAAHLSHMFRDILGISPRELFGANRALVAEVEPMVNVAKPVA